jgi:hypothetical protein
MVGGGGAGRGTIARGSSWPTTHAQPALVCMRRNMAPTFISPPMSAAPLAPPPPRTWIVPVCACPATPCAERSTNTDVKARILAGTVDRPTMQRDCGRETAREHFGHDTSRPYGLPQPLDLQIYDRRSSSSHLAEPRMHRRLQLDWIEADSAPSCRETIPLRLPAAGCCTVVHFLRQGL